MIKKLLQFIYKTKTNWSYASCYTKMEYTGYAAMDCCGGLIDVDQHAACRSCPHYVELPENNKMKGELSWKLEQL